jgi:hypothetical protein
VYWQVLEERIADATPEPLDAEIEHRAAADVGEATLFVDGQGVWIAGPDGGLLASLFVSSTQI